MLAVIHIICLAHCLLGMTGVVNVSGGCAQSGWSAGPNMPTVLVRAVGVYFQPNGNFYTVGGRTADTAGSDFQHVLQYYARFQQLDAETFDIARQPNEQYGLRRVNRFRNAFRSIAWAVLLPDRPQPPLAYSPTTR